METLKFRFNSDIAGYKAMLKDIRKELEKNPNKIIPIRNDSFEHAVALVSDIIRHADERILIYSCALCKPFYENDEISSALKEAIKDGKIFKILVKHIDKDAIATIQDTIQDNDNLKSIQIKKGKIIYDDKNTDLNDFIVSGDAFRYELERPTDVDTDVDILQKCHMKPYSVKAVASLKDSESASLLKKAFDKSFEIAEEIN